MLTHTAALIGRKSPANAIVLSLSLLLAPLSACVVSIYDFDPNRYIGGLYDKYKIMVEV